MTFNSQVTLTCQRKCAVSYIVIRVMLREKFHIDTMGKVVETYSKEYVWTVQAPIPDWYTESSF